MSEELNEVFALYESLKLPREKLPAAWSAKMRKEWYKWKKRRYKATARKRRAKEKQTHEGCITTWEHAEFAVQITRIGRHLPDDWDIRKRGRYWEWKRCRDTRSKFASYKRGAKTRGHCWELEYEHFEWLLRQPCEYCGVLCAGGIDRKDNEQGYTLENAVPCDEMCNRMKLDWTCEAFIQRAHEISSHNRNS